MKHLPLCAPPGQPAARSALSQLSHPPLFAEPHLIVGLKPFALGGVALTNDGEPRHLPDFSIDLHKQWGTLANDWALLPNGRGMLLAGLETGVAGLETGGEGAFIRVLSFENGATTQVLGWKPPFTPERLHLSPNGSLFCIRGHRVGEIQIYPSAPLLRGKAPTLIEIAEIGNSSVNHHRPGSTYQTKDAVFISETEMILSLEGSQDIIVSRLSGIGGRQTHTIIDSWNHAYAPSLAISGDGKTLAAAHRFVRPGDPNIEIYDVARDAATKKQAINFNPGTLGSSILMGEISPDYLDIALNHPGDRFAASIRSSVIVEGPTDPIYAEQVKIWNCPFVKHLEYTGGGKALIGGSEHCLWLFDLTSGKPCRLLGESRGGLKDLTVRPVSSLCDGGLGAAFAGIRQLPKSVSKPDL